MYKIILGPSLKVCTILKVSFFCLDKSLYISLQSVYDFLIILCNSFVLFTACFKALKYMLFQGNDEFGAGKITNGI